MFEEVIALDPNYAGPYSTLGWTYLNSIYFSWSHNPLDDFEKAEKYAQQAIAVNEAMDHAHSLLSQIFLFKRQYDRAIEEAQRAVALAPNGAMAYALFGFTLTFAARKNYHSAKESDSSQSNPAGLFLILSGSGISPSRPVRRSSKSLSKGPFPIPRHFSCTAWPFCLLFCTGSRAGGPQSCGRGPEVKSRIFPGSVFHVPAV